MVSAVMEGSDAVVCVDISGIPSGGLECDVMVQLSATNGSKAGQSYCYECYRVCVYVYVYVGS